MNEKIRQALDVTNVSTMMLTPEQLGIALRERVALALEGAAEIADDWARTSNYHEGAECLAEIYQELAKSIREAK